MSAGCVGLCLRCWKEEKCFCRKCGDYYWTSLICDGIVCKVLYFVCRVCAAMMYLLMPSGMILLLQLFNDRSGKSSKNKQQYWYEFYLYMVVVFSFFVQCLVIVFFWIHYSSNISDTLYDFGSRSEEEAYVDTLLTIASIAAIMTLFSFMAYVYTFKERQRLQEKVGVNSHYLPPQNSSTHQNHTMLTTPDETEENSAQYDP